MSKVETQKMQNHTKLSNNVNPAEFCIVLQFFDFYDFVNFCKLIKFCKIAVCDKYKSVCANVVFATKYEIFSRMAGRHDMKNFVAHSEGHKTSYDLRPDSYVTFSPLIH